MHLKLLFVLLLFNTGILLAQQNDSIIVVFTISDQNGVSVPDVWLTINQGIFAQDVVSNELGKAICKVEKYGEIKTTFTHTYYTKLTTIEEIHENTQLDTIYFKVTLTSIKSLNLAEVKVNAPGVPEIVYSSKLNSVQDFEILDQNNIVLLTYPKRLKKSSQLLLYNPLGSVKDSIEIEKEAIELIRDYEGHLYLIHTNGCMRIFVSEDKLDLLDISLLYLKRYLMPIVGVSESKMYFSTYDKLYPSFDYYFYNVIDSTYTKFASVIDDEMMEMYRAEYRFADMNNPIDTRRKLEAKNYELSTGIDAEVYYGRKYFTQSVYYEPPFGPMFQLNDNLYLFDYHCDSLKVFNTEGILLSKVSITHDHNERRNGWQKRLIMDPVLKTIYALYERAGFSYLNAINLSNGKLRSPIKLNNRYAEGIQVYNGYIYYVYRPFESYQKKYFWREKTPN